LKNISKNSNANVVSPIEMLFQLNRRSGMLIEDQPNGKKKIKMLFALGSF